MKKHLIDIAYELVKKKFKKKKFTYRELYKEISSINKLETNDSIDDLYVEMISDIRFLSIGNDYWILKENVSFEEFQKVKNAMFGIDEIKFDDIDESELEALKKQKENEIKENEISITYDDLDENFDEKKIAKKLFESEDEEVDENDEVIDTDSSEDEDVEDIDIDNDDLDDLK